MSRTKWGVVAAVCVVAAIIAWALMDGYRSGDRTGTGTAPTTTANTSGQDATGSGVQESGESDADQDAVPGAGGESGAGSTATAPEPETDPELQEEAESYVEQLAKPTDEPLRIDRAETFAGSAQTLVGAVASGAGKPAETPDTGRVDPEAPDQPEAGPDTTGGASAPEITGGTAPQDAPSTGLEATTVATAAEGDTAEDTTQPEATGGETATDSEPGTRIDLPVTEAAPVTIAELLEPLKDIPPDAVFYVHTVQPENDQGIWGIVHTGIAENFAEGVAVHRGETTETYQVDIPPHADERKPDSSSSFLGKLIHEKTRQSYVYNYETDRIGQNPDVILPGQEIVIVSFSPQELIDIYKHFARGGGS